MLCKSDLILISCKPSTLSFDIVRTLNLLTWKLKNEELTQYDDSAKALLWALIKIKLEIYPRIYMNLSIKWRPAPEKLRYKERKKNLSSWQKKHRIMLWPFWPHNSLWSLWNSSGEQWLIKIKTTEALDVFFHTGIAPTQCQVLSLELLSVKNIMIFVSTCFIIIFQT